MMSFVSVSLNSARLVALALSAFGIQDMLYSKLLCWSLVILDLAGVGL